MNNFPELYAVIKSRYRIEANGFEFKISRRNCFGWWSEQETLFKLQYLGGDDWMNGEGLRCAEKNLEWHVQKELDRVLRRKNGWRSV
jgi:hypothetical protein